MKKKWLAIILTLALLLPLVSCGNKDGHTVPEDMQLCAGGDALGYYFYVPEGWTISNLGDVSMAFVSAVNQTSLSLVEVPMPTGELSDYFDAHKSDFPYEITLTSENEPINFGNATRAVSYVYSFTYLEVGYRTLQILATYGERFFIFTFTSYSKNYTKDQTYYEYYLGRIQNVLDNVEFVGKVPSDTPTPDYERDADGFALVSDKVIAGFAFYMAPGWTCDTATGLVRVTASDRANVVISEATSTGMSVDEYWENRKAGLKIYVDDLTAKTFETEGADGPVTREFEVTTLGNATVAYRFEYTFTYQGESYRVSQWLAVGGTALSKRGFVMTYTAKAADFDLHTEDVAAMAGKIVF